MAPEQDSGSSVSVSDNDMNRLRRIKEKYAGELLRKAHVVGIGIGYRDSAPRTTGEPAIVVSVTHKVPPDQLRAEDLIPRELEGVPVEVRAVGTLHAADAAGAQTDILYCQGPHPESAPEQQERG